MSTTQFLLDVFRKKSGEAAIIWHERPYSYSWILDQIYYWNGVLALEQITAGHIVIFEAEFSPNSVALLMALIEASCIIVPLTKSVRDKRAEFIDIARGEILLTMDQNDQISIERTGQKAGHVVYQKLRTAGHPGLVLFSSGSTGKSKAAVHDFVPILEKFRIPRNAYRTIAFLLFDHIGGVNTLLYTLSNGGTLIICEERTPDAVLDAVEKFRAELLPTSPTFINLILLSEAYENHDLGSLKLVTYGTEAMPETTLKRFHALFPNIQLSQTYGLSEVGILRAKSKSSDSVWLKIGGEGFQTRVVDGALQIKANSAMLGYLNAPSPFTEDGWFMTGDSVEVDGEYLKILGRNSELINVGGEKVYPCEVESVIQEFENVAEVAVYGEKNHLVGNIVCARVRLKEENGLDDFAGRLKRFCRDRMQPYKIPVKIALTTQSQYGERYKKMRQAAVSRFRIEFGPGVSTRVRARMSYAFRVFCAIYGHAVADHNLADQAICVFYDSAPPPESLPGAIYIPARYVERSTNEAAPRTAKSLYACEWFDLFYGRDNLGRPDWLGEIFEWISSAHEMSLADRDSVGRIPYEKGVFSRQGLSPLRPHALLAMAWLEGYLTNGIANKELVKAPSPVKGTDHFVVSSHDIDVHWAMSWPWHERVKRQLKNLIISLVESRSASLARATLARLFRALIGRPVDDFLPALLKAGQQHGFRSTLFVIVRSVHRRDANYQIEELGPRLRQAAAFGFGVDLHGSYASIVENCDLLSEAEHFSDRLLMSPAGCRQHWLRFDSHQKLFNEIERARLHYDSTLGFSNQVGFRNGACFAFPPYDFASEQACNFLEIPLAIMDRALVHAGRSSGKSCSDLADTVFSQSRRFGWGGISVLWHNPVEDVYVPREVNQIMWDQLREKTIHREKWVSATEFIASSLTRYHDAGLLKNIKFHAQPAHR